MTSSPPSIAALANAFRFSDDGAEVLRDASRFVVYFPAAKALTFATRTSIVGPRQEAAVAVLLADAGVPTIQRIAGPVDVSGWIVTAWHELPGFKSAPPANIAQVGQLAQRLHRATFALDPRGRAQADPLGASLGQLELALDFGRTSDPELRVLRSVATRLEPVWSKAVEASKAAGEHLGAASGAILHGDLHRQNVLVSSNGPVLVDLELSGWGPVAYDAAPTVGHVRFYGLDPTSISTFDDAYGTPLCDAALLTGLVDVWALWVTCWSVANRHRDGQAEEEAAKRVATLAGDEVAEDWTLL